MTTHDQKYLVLLPKNQENEGIQAIRHYTQMNNDMRVSHSRDGREGVLSQEQLDHSDIVILDRLGVAIVNRPVPIEQGKSLMAASGKRSVPILAVVENETWYALEIPKQSSKLFNSRQYLQGYRDGVNHLVDHLLSPADVSDVAVAATFDERRATWGLQATNVLSSPYSGRGIRVAVLDTGMDLNHPDFIGRTIVSESFVDGETVQDDNGHGTHCIGTACGPRTPAILPRYGIAYEAEIYAGKVLSNEGGGSVADVLAGINWAIDRRCAVISMSLGGEVLPGRTFDTSFYEDVGQRALDEDSLIIAAAGNRSRRPGRIRPVDSPANAPSIMAVAALDSDLEVADFSNAGINPSGGEVDIAGPGVDVYSSAPHSPSATPQPPDFRVWSDRYDTISGTSMATPHVAGIAALYAEATDSRGDALWNLLTRNARRLTLPSRDVGTGLVQAPSS